ncbi:MAG: hypothetical protein FWG34_13105 [Oscillospiraceae bacterium]|nr:hypothetical protein [Oscillospiraceae bacterium]
MAKKKKFKLKKEEQNEENISPYARFVGKYGQSQKRKRTPEQISEYKKLALLLVGWSILAASAYIVCIQFEFYPILPIYTFGGAALLILWLVFNGGFKKIDLDKIEKPDEMGYDEFCKFIDKLKERQKKAKYLLAFFLPLLVIMLVDWYINLRHM